MHPAAALEATSVASVTMAPYVQAAQMDFGPPEDFAGDLVALLGFGLG